jgi:hypothetical protein
VSKPGENWMKKGQQDRDRIDVSEDHEPGYWSEKLDVSHNPLKSAVEKVGPIAKDVQNTWAGRFRITTPKKRLGVNVG